MTYLTWGTNNVCKVSIGKAQRKIPVCKCRCGKKDNVKMEQT
jgi:hypothetical protein